MYSSGKDSFQLFNIDSSLEPLSDHEITAALIDIRTSSMAYNDVVRAHKKRLDFVLEFSTRNELHWRKLAKTASARYWIKDIQIGVLVFDANPDCGYIRTYRVSRYTSDFPKLDVDWAELKDEGILYEILNTPANNGVFTAWQKHMDYITALPIEFATGRLENTSTEKVFLILKGNGCVVCGGTATCFAATTMGTASAAVLVKMPLCAEHIASARSYPFILSFLASLFNLKWDWPNLAKHDSIQDELIPTIHCLMAKELGGVLITPEKRVNGWLLRLNLPSGWSWRLRLNNFNDYAYMLFDPDEEQRYRADSAPHHSEVKFPPHHEHSTPMDKEKDSVTPSFLFGHPLFDMKRLRNAGRSYGAY
ncbi:hypothetical protein [Pseudomonas orientalis]|uniref:hypothetical protein n=1 Tax=Pseudomonas orientalis TaxID=76758 RepID=UPI0030DA2750